MSSIPSPVNQSSTTHEGVDMNDSADSTKSLILWISSTGQKFSLSTPTLQIGRGEKCTIRIANDGQVSTHHGIIESGVLSDTNSTNGTSVNGRRLRPGEAHRLRCGDVIIIGLTELHVLEDSSSPGDALPADLSGDQVVTQRYTAQALRFVNSKPRMGGGMFAGLNSANGMPSASSSSAGSASVPSTSSDVITAEDELQDPPSVILRSSTLPPPVDEILNGDSESVRQQVEQLRNDLINLRRKEAFARRRQVGGALGGNGPAAAAAYGIGTGGNYAMKDFMEFQAKITELNNEIQGLKFNLHYGTVDSSSPSSSSSSSSSSDQKDKDGSSSAISGEEYTRLLEENITLKHTVETLQSQLNAQKTTISQMDAIQDQLKDLQQKYTTLQEKHNVMTSNYEHEVVNRVEIEADLAQRIPLADYQIVKDQLEDLQKEYHTIVQKQQPSEQRITELEQELHQQKQLHEEYVKAGEAKYKQLEQQYITQQQQSQNNNSTAEQSLTPNNDDQITSLQQQVTSLDQQLKQVADQHTQLQQDHSKLQQQYQQQQESFDNDKNALIATHQEELQKLQKQQQTSLQPNKPQEGQDEQSQISSDIELNEQKALVLKYTADNQRLIEQHDAAKNECKLLQDQIDQLNKTVNTLKASSSSSSSPSPSTDMNKPELNDLAAHLQQIQQMDPRTLMILLLPTALIVAILSSILRG